MVIHLHTINSSFKALYLHHQNISENDIERHLGRVCSHRMLIGCSRQPSCLKPSGSRRTDSGIAYYRLYRQNLTYLYFRGFPLSTIRRLQDRIQREIRKWFRNRDKFPLYFSISKIRTTIFL